MVTRFEILQEENPDQAHVVEKILGCEKGKHNTYWDAEVPTWQGYRNKDRDTRFRQAKWNPVVAAVLALLPDIDLPNGVVSEETGECDTYKVFDGYSIASRKKGEMLRFPMGAGSDLVLTESQLWDVEYLDEETKRPAGHETGLWRKKWITVSALAAMVRVAAIDYYRRFPGDYGVLEKLENHVIPEDLREIKSLFDIPEIEKIYAEQYRLSKSFAEARSLPKLTGTARQKQWAETIRAVYFAECELQGEAPPKEVQNQKSARYWINSIKSGPAR